MEGFTNSDEGPTFSADQAQYWTPSIPPITVQGPLTQVVFAKVRGRVPHRPSVVVEPGFRTAVRGKGLHGQETPAIHHRRIIIPNASGHQRYHKGCLAQHRFIRGDGGKDRGFRK